ncbi:MAG: histidine phosphatase family protein [Oscillospiraceae bacterium]|nr:histidine phosphatase family protein [Oscillospiraceae bacterium]
MKGYRISILRHGRTSANEKSVYIGKTDLPLSDSGRKELEEKRKKYEYPNVQKVYSSPLCRAYQSAEILFPNREIALVDSLSEMDFGIFEGLSVDQCVELDTYKKWLKGGLDNPPPNGESVREMVIRCGTALNTVIMDMMREEVTHAGVITHSGIIMNMMSCFGLPKMKPLNFACEVGEGYEIMVTAMLWQNGQTFEILGKIPNTLEADEDEMYAGESYEED